MPGAEAIFGLSLLVLPTVLIVVAHIILAARPARWAIRLTVAALWAVALWLWADYSRQTDDVGLMAIGILAMAVTASAMLATLAAAVIRWRRR